MAGTTSPDNLPFPSDNDDPDFATDMFSLAQAVQTALDARTAADGSLSAALDAKVLYGPTSALPGSLQPGQLYAGWSG